MVIQTKITEDNDALLISIKGKFDFSLLNEFRQAYSNTTTIYKHVVLDLRSASTIDSSALGMLLNMQRHLKKADGEIRIINCNSDVMKIFQISHFDKKFTIE